jgi:pectin methylesterase-like acyl-CoA thioesterase
MSGGCGSTHAAAPGGDAGPADAGMETAPAVTSTVPLAALFPAAGGQGLCADVPLRLTLTGPPMLGSAGLIQVWDASATGTPVASVDMAAATYTETLEGMVFNLPRPVYVDGNDVIVRLHGHALDYGKSYYVTIDPGALAGADGSPLVIADSTTWTFGTAAGPPADLTALAVAPDGSAPFCSVQGALDALPAGNMTPATVTLAPGTYYEIVYFASKSNVTLQGQDRKLSVIAATNNNSLNNSSKARALVGIDNSTGVVVRNLTIHNLTPQGGSQAEALRFGNCDKCIVRDADILSLQDTLQWNGRIYADNCYIEGNVDFVWGTGGAYFNNCEIKTVGRTGFDVQARNAAAATGYVFVDSRLTSDPGITGNMLARIDVGMYPGSNVAYINCELGSHISPAGWLITGGTDTSLLRFMEYQSHTPAGDPVDVSQRVAGSIQLTDEQAAMMRDPTMVLYGWQPGS